MLSLRPRSSPAYMYGLTDDIHNLRAENKMLRDALLHVLKACNEHPTEAGRLLSEDFVKRLKDLRGMLTAA